MNSMFWTGRFLFYLVFVPPFHKKNVESFLFQYHYHWRKLKLVKFFLSSFLAWLILCICARARAFFPSFYLSFPSFALIASVVGVKSLFYLGVSFETSYTFQLIVNVEVVCYVYVFSTVHFAPSHPYFSAYSHFFSLYCSSL